MKIINYLFQEKKDLKVTNIQVNHLGLENIIKISFYYKSNIPLLRRNQEYCIKNQKNILLIQGEEK
jgi:hypothetical protein